MHTYARFRDIAFRRVSINRLDSISLEVYELLLGYNKSYNTLFIIFVNNYASASANFKS